MRSLWRVELTKIRCGRGLFMGGAVNNAVLVDRFGGQFTEWGQPFRLRHVVTGDNHCVVNH